MENSEQMGIKQTKQKKSIETFSFSLSRPIVDVRP